VSKDDQYSWDMDPQSNARYDDQVPYGSQESYDDTASLTVGQELTGQESTGQESMDQRSTAWQATGQQQPSNPPSTYQQPSYQQSTGQQQPTGQPSTARQSSEQAPTDTILPQTRAATVAVMAGLCIFVIRRLPLLSFVCAIVAVIAALIAFCRIKTGRFSGKISAIIGLVVGIFSLVVFFPGTLREIRTMENEGLLPNFSAASTFSYQTVTVTEAYRLKDDSPVTVKVSSGVNYDDWTKIVQTFPMQ
jgi:hypothetical protein